MIRKIFLVCSAAASIFVYSFCHAGTEAGDAYFKGINLAANGNLQEARDALSRALSDESFKPFAQLEIDAIDEALNGKVSKEIAIRAFKGKSYAVEKKWNQAISEYYKVIEASPSFVYAYVSRGNAFLETRSYGSAISDFSEAIKLTPSDSDLYNKRGVAYQWNGNIDKAIKEYSSAIEINPNSALYYCNRGRAYYVKGKPELALADLDEAIKLKPNYIDAFLVKGWTCEDLNRNDEAITAYRKTIELDVSESKEATKEAEAAIRDIENMIKKEAEKKKADDSKKDK